MNTLLSTIEAGLAAALPDLVVELADPNVARRRAELILATDAAARLEFKDDAVALSAYLRSIAAPKLRAALRAIASDAEKPSPRKPAPPAAVALATQSPPAASTAVHEPAALHASARLSLADAGVALGVRLGDLPMTTKVTAALRLHGLAPERDQDGDVTLDANNVARIAADRAAADAMILSLIGSVPRLGYVPGGSVAVG